MRVLVTGGTGFTGTHLTRRLLRDGHEVVTIDTQPGLFAADLGTCPRCSGPMRWVRHHRQFATHVRLHRRRRVVAALTVGVTGSARSGSQA